MKKVFCVISAVILSLSGLKAREQYIFTQISQKEGLTSTINCIYKEKQGDIWICTPNGLYSFNGNSLRHHDDTLFSGRRIYKVNHDAKGNLWVLTDRWLALRKLGEDRFRKVVIPGHEQDRAFYSTCFNENGIWFGSLGKIFKYTYEDESIRLFSDIPDRSSFMFWHMNILDANSILCCSHNGIILIDINSGKSSTAPYGSFREVSSMLVDSSGRIWIAFYNNGIDVYNQDGTRIKRYSTSESNLSSNLVMCMTERDSLIWVGTDGGGINIIDPETDRTSVLSHVAGDPSSLPAHSIKSIYTDHHGNIWAGSVRDGVIRIRNSEMNTYSDAHIGLSSGLSNPTVLYLYQDPRSNHIWVGTDGEGINRFDPSTNQFKHYSSTLKTKVVSIAEYSDQELVVSVYSDRLWLFNKNTGAIRPLDVVDHDLNYQFRYAGIGINVANEKDGRLIIISNVVYRLDRSSGRCTKILKEGGMKATGNILLIGDSDQGIWMHDRHDLLFLETGSNVLKKIGRLEDTYINCGHMDKDGTIWLATDNGLCRFSASDSSFSFIRTDLFDRAISVVCDNNSRVWVGTENHLFAYLKDSDNFAMFGISDGAAQNEYLSKPHLLARNGAVYLGGVKGMLHIEPSFSIDNTEEPDINLHELLVDGEPYVTGLSTYCELPRNSKTFTIRVSAQETDILREKRYRFYVSNNSEAYETEYPSLSIHQKLSPGTYDIMASCTKRNGEWSIPAHILTLRIPQPWYFTWWFISITALFLMSIAVLSVFMIIRRKESEMRLAMKEQEQKMYEEKVQFLINISHELRTPLTLVMAPLKRLLKKTDSDEDSYKTLQRIYRQSRRMKDLLNMVLDLRKMEVGKSRLKIETISFNQWIGDAIKDIAEEEQTQGINIRTDLDPAVGTVDMDKTKCDTILTNILMNAVKHSSAGDTITVRTRLDDSGFVRTSISDQGPGLGEIDMNRIFTRFYQSNSEQYGSGIGLSYSKILTELHGGRIGAEDNPDKGATFWWELPVMSAESSADTPAKAYLNELIGYNQQTSLQSQEDTVFKTNDKTLMLVDDSSDLLEFLKESLNGEFAEIITADSGQKALRMINSGTAPDIIVSDINMPDGDGYWLCRELKGDEKSSHIPLILLTARGEEQSQSDSYRLGADAFMAKPFDTDTLLALLRNLLKNKTDIRRRYLDSEDKAMAGYGSNEESFIIRLNSIISQHLSDPDLDQQLICRELGISRALLYNKMKSIAGTGAKEYISRIRLEKAKSLIEKTSLSIAEISEMTGFSAQSYFSTAFKNYTGLTPSQYKQKNGLKS